METSSCPAPRQPQRQALALFTLCGGFINIRLI